VDDIHQWVDVRGRIIRASFVKADDNAVTVRLQGAQSMIRPADLSPQSQEMLRQLVSSGKGNKNDFIDWTDKTGRAIRARLVKSVGDNLQIELEGTIFELPLAQLNAESQKLAKALAKESNEPAPPPVTGKDEAQEWKDANGRAIRARFIKLVGETLTIELDGKPFDIPLARLRPDSQALARQLADKVKPRPDKSPKGKPAEEQIEQAMERDRLTKRKSLSP
jgi:hypothetical protein